MSRAPNPITRGLAPLALAAALLAVVASTVATATARQGGRPVVEREVVKETYVDDFIFDICGVETNTTSTQRTTTQTWPDGTETVHIFAEFVPEDPSIATERFSRTDIYEPDGSVTIKGLAIRLYRHGEGTIIRDAGWLRVLEDGVVVRGPHPFFETDPADAYC